ncbi:hypothetical protein JOD62_000246 [Microbacterium keratanolyticum]|uniref:Uncharacterized protein n=1 Tax=Microbacterium keratanolyticum TaxID=67574 RepID=A0A9W6M9V3_9MICO|nr:hypothetical protein [Microbacterium keratanolyticum]MBM7467698.1 hypothetical protein [Microbacterium keratanolyticum]GLK02691.1 hypothetical protein GCM10017596_24060 [Microbacterium keratanolyticum]
MTDTAQTSTGTPRWLSWIVLGATGLFYAYAVWNAVAHLIGLAGLGLNAMGWFTLLFAVIFPMLVFAVGVALTRRRNAGEQSLVLLAGLGLVAVFWLNVVGYTSLNLDALLG